MLLYCILSVVGHLRWSEVLLNWEEHIFFFFFFFYIVFLCLKIIEQKEGMMLLPTYMNFCVRLPILAHTNVHPFVDWCPCHWVRGVISPQIWSTQRLAPLPPTLVPTFPLCSPGPNIPPSFYICLPLCLNFFLCTSPTPFPSHQLALACSKQFFQIR